MRPGLLLAALCLAEFAHTGYAFATCTEAQQCNYGGCGNVKEKCGQNCVNGVWKHKCSGGSCFHEFKCGNSNCDIECPDPPLCKIGHFSPNGKDAGGNGKCRPCASGWTTSGPGATVCDNPTAENQGIQLCYTHDLFMPAALMHNEQTCLSSAKKWIVQDKDEWCSKNHYEIDRNAWFCCKEGKSACFLPPLKSYDFAVKVMVILEAPSTAFDDKLKMRWRAALTRAATKISREDVTIEEIKALSLKDCQDCTYIKSVVKAQDRPAGLAIAEKFKADNIQLELAKDGMPPLHKIVGSAHAVEYSDVDVSTTSRISKGESTGQLLGGAVGGIAFVLLLLFMVLRGNGDSGSSVPTPPSDKMRPAEKESVRPPADQAVQEVETPPQSKVNSAPASKPGDSAWAKKMEPGETAGLYYYNVV